MQFQNNLLGESITKHSIYGKERYDKYCKSIAAIRRKRGRKIFPLGQISKEIIKQQRWVSQQCSSTLFAGQHKICRGMTLIAEPPKVTELTHGNSQGQRIYDTNGLSCTLSSQGGGMGAKTGLYCVGKLNKGQSGNVYDPKGVATTICANGGGMGAKTGLYAVPVLTPNRPNKRQNGRRLKENGEPMFTLTSQDRHGVMIIDGKKYIIRRLIPVECEKLQGFPVDWTKYGIIDGKKKLMSDTQRYKMTGNSVTTNVIEAIAREILKGDIKCVTD